MSICDILIIIDYMILCFLFDFNTYVFITDLDYLSYYPNRALPSFSEVIGIVMWPI